MEDMDSIVDDATLEFDFNYKDTPAKVLLEVKDLTFGYTADNILFKDIAKQLFGNTKLFISDSISQSKNYLLQIKDKLTSTLFVFNEQAINLISLIKSLLLIFFGFTIGFLYKKWIF